MKKLAIITTHPIQYNAPLFRLLAQRRRIAVKVFYTWGQAKDAVYDARFGRVRQWDIPLLEGYEYEFVTNVARHPDSNRFWGVVNPRLLRRLQQEQFDALLVYRWSLWSHLRLMQTRPGGMQLLFRGDSVWNSGGLLKEVFRQWLLRFVYRKVNTALYVGARNKTYYEKAGLQPGQLVYAPHAVENTRFAAAAAEREEAARKKRSGLQLPDDAVVFLYAGKFYAVKQLDLLIHAFRQLPGNHFRLLLVGNGEQEQDLRQQAAGDDRILFLPFANQSEMPVVYRMSDVFVLPSKSETWGLAVNEAMACGRPAIVSDACGCAPELIIPGTTGFVFASGNEGNLLQQLQACADKSRLRQMGVHALQHIQQFSLERVAAAIEEAVAGAP